MNDKRKEKLAGAAVDAINAYKLEAIPALTVIKCEPDPVQQIPKGKIGGSGVAATVKLNGRPASKWSSPHDLYRTLIGEKEIEPSEIMVMGHDLEPRNVRRTILKIDPNGGKAGQWLQPDTVTHPDLPWARFSLDAINPTKRWGIDAKNADPMNRHQWGENESDGIPTHYRIQAEFYSHFFKLKKFTFGVYFGHRKHRVFHMRPDPEIGAFLFANAIDFWVDHIEGKRPPPIDATAGCKDWLDSRPAKPAGKIREATQLEKSLIAQLEAAEATAAAADQAVELLKNSIKAAIGEDAGIDAGRSVMTYKAQKGRKSTSWSDAKKEIIKKWPEAAAIIEAHTTTGESRRVLRKKAVK